ncbi:hypothetical protein FNV43_RR11674 [Rhamnella rubrinervis]|uniref:Uncharacterized protein n=1 Tax=Rhamnella rubrinervis TaxID=2594499 RepID=A0A8K0MI36_9ROSA|nr:hypothetical protein FNV43_RR11674 [Rhamnella rubrinervis]
MAASAQGVEEAVHGHKGGCMHKGVGGGVRGCGWCTRQKGGKGVVNGVEDGGSRGWKMLATREKKKKTFKSDLEKKREEEKRK